jgi:hypothetical protein
LHPSEPAGRTPTSEDSLQILDQIVPLVELFVSHVVLTDVSATASELAVATQCVRNAEGSVASTTHIEDIRACAAIMVTKVFTQLIHANLEACGLLRTEAELIDQLFQVCQTFTVWDGQRCERRINGFP